MNRILQSGHFLTEEQNRNHLVISQGLFSSKKILIPSIWIDRVLEDELVRSWIRIIERIPEYEQKSHKIDIEFDYESSGCHFS
jgi:hypothetical protein